MNVNDDLDEENELNNDSTINSIDFDWHNPNSETSLRRAVRANNISLVEDLLRNGANPNMTDNRGWTPVHESARSDSSVDILNLLITYGAFLNHRTFKGETPLFIACSNGAVKVARILVESECDMNIPNNENNTPLHEACAELSRFQLIELFINAGAQLDVKNIGDESPLFIAIGKKNLEACKLLLKAGASLNITDGFERTPLHYACSEGDFDIFELLAKYCGDECLRNYRTQADWTLLMEAAQSKNCQIVKYLLDAGVDPDAVDNRQVLALHVAAHSGCAECFKMLLAATSNEAILNYCTFSSNPISLTCLVLDSRSYENLVTLFDANLNWSVLTCPIVKKKLLYNPYSYILSLRSVDPSEKLSFLSFMLERKLPLDPEYLDWPLKIVSPVEAVFRLFKYAPEQKLNCCRYLKLILENGANPDIMKKDEADMENCLPKSFCLAFRLCFIEGLALLLRYSNVIEPNKLLETYCAWLVSPSYTYMGNEIEVFKFLAPLCTNISSILKNFSHEKLFQIHEMLLKQDLTYSLKQLCRVAIRNELHNASPLEHTAFKKNLYSLNVPKSITEYLSYGELLG